MKKVSLIFKLAFIFKSEWPNGEHHKFDEHHASVKQPFYDEVKFMTEDSTQIRLNILNKIGMCHPLNSLVVK